MSLQSGWLTGWASDMEQNVVRLDTNPGWASRDDERIVPQGFVNWPLFGKAQHCTHRGGHGENHADGTGGDQPDELVALMCALLPGPRGWK